jgi:AcrR family transcriptional regulator
MPVTEPRKRRPYTPRMPAEERRRQLLDAAIAIIARDGYAGVSVDAIAREADVSRTVVYGVFDSLDELLYALLDRQEGRAMGQLLAALPSDLGDARLDELVLAVVRQWASAVAGDPETWRPILLEPEGQPRPVRERIAGDRDAMRLRIQALLELGVAGGVAGGRALDAEMAGHAVIALAEYFGRLIVADPEGFDVERLVAAIGSLLGALRL